MTPRWPIFSDEPGKRSSVFSFTSDHRISTEESIHAFDSAPSETICHRDRVNQDSNSVPTSPRKRRARFTKSPATPDKEDNTRAWATLPVMERLAMQVTGPKDDLVSAWETNPEHTRRSAPRRHGRHEPIMRWMRRVENSTVKRMSIAQPASPAYSDDEDIDHREQKKAKISAPFNFQHVLHTMPRELPELDFTSDHDLGLSFWASSLSQTPATDLRGIKADKVEDAQRSPVTGAHFLELRPQTSDQASPSTQQGGSVVGRPLSSPIARATSLNRGDSRLRDGSKRLTGLARSASLASLIAMPRTPPTMVHPAFRTPPEPQSSLLAPSSPVLPDSCRASLSDTGRNLDSVPEELDGPSEATFSSGGSYFLPNNDSVEGAQMSPHESAMSKASHHSQRSSFFSDCQDTTFSVSRNGTSVASVTTAETWEEDGEYRSSPLGTDATRMMLWQSEKHTCYPPETHDSIIDAPGTIDFDPVKSGNNSPGFSVAQHQRNRSSMTMTPNTIATTESTSRRDSVTRSETSEALPAEAAHKVEPVSPSRDHMPDHMPDASVAISSYEGPLSAGHPPESGSVMELAGAFETCSLSQETEHREFAPILLSNPPSLPFSGTEVTGGPATVPQITVADVNGFTSKPEQEEGEEEPEWIMRRPSLSASRSLLAAGRNVQATRKASTRRLRYTRSAEHIRPSDNGDGQQRKSCVTFRSINELLDTHAVPKTSEKFPALS